jgi:catechol 2,3-dioxygenase-like lactoylglutathione lyase family enzyme
MKIRTFPVILFLVGTRLAAQLMPANEAGATMGSLELIVQDAEAQTHFLVDMMGGRLMMNGKVSEIEFPGVYILVRQGHPAGPSAGSVVDHFGFVVKDIGAERAKWRANNITLTQSPQNANQGYVIGPEGIRIEVFGEPELPTRVQMNHVHFRIMQKDIPAFQAWYSKLFGWVPSTRESVSRPGNFMATNNLPGNINLSLAPANELLAPTRGRFIDHIGFEVRDIDVFFKKLTAEGIKFEGPVHKLSGSQNLKVAFLTDPWGTRIQLSEGLTPVYKDPGSSK